MRISLTTINPNRTVYNGEFIYHIDDYRPTTADPVKQAREAFELLTTLLTLRHSERLTSYENKEECIVVSRLDSSPFTWLDAPKSKALTPNQTHVSYEAIYGSKES